MTRRYLAWAGTAAAVAFVIVLALPDHDRVLGLFAYLLLIGALALAALVAPLALHPFATDGRLAPASAAGEVRPEELETIERELRDARAAGLIEEPLRRRIRSIASARLMRSHGIDLERQAEAARALLAGTALAELLGESAATPRAQRLRAPALGRVLEEIEQL